MGIYTAEEYTDMIIMYGLAGENARAAARLYEERYPNRRHPGAKVIYSCVHRTRTTGSVFPKRAERCVSPKDEDT